MIGEIKPMVTDDDFTPFDPFPGNPIPEPIPPFVPPGTDPPTPTPNPNPGPGPTTGGSGAIVDRDLVLKIESTRFPFDAYPGDVIPFHITVKNGGNVDLPNTKIVIIEQDLALRYSAGPFDLNRGDKEQRILLFEVPADLEPGIYPVRFTITSNSVTKRVVYRDIDVLPLQ